MTSLQEDLRTFHIQRFDITDGENTLNDLEDSLPSADLASLTEDDESPSEEVDLKQLAQKVYTLLKKELRIEQERRPKHRALW